MLKCQRIAGFEFPFKSVSEISDCSGGPYAFLPEQYRPYTIKIGDV